MKDYLELAKLRIVTMVVATCAIGFFFAGGSGFSLLTWTLLATALAAAACGALNQLIEHKRDALMRRTRTRPLPAGRLEPLNALIFGLVCAQISLAIFLWKVNILSAAITAVTIALYLLVYTPMKLLTPQSTWAGAAAGATGPLIGWAAVRSSLGPEAWALFAIQFLWQIPHFQAIFWLHREDYSRAGFRVAAVVDPAGHLTAFTIAIHSMALLGASLIPVFFGMTGPGYGLAALTLSSAFLALGLRASWTMAPIDARRLFLGSLLYLPLLLGILAAGKT